ncbi:DUF4302 domain-containing protein [Chitinophaga sancti]|uniref:DUF4302 domain-containing protein n=1 Tax=Chitinophaga sancti TaxID=1004 RepID=A0A1K1SHD0_9BACT|nr:DUF4302 domain-containing protein [Chitinophaga sancti]WQD61835.1 DUF4302 domain-containing protein [Chitinophaga sancti]WQG92596.1 DUF4302 domain-containing protein [Chitinophaga sancti]SFW83779.1 protein of unknown function [Chitinophaga sancti]
MRTNLSLYILLTALLFAACKKEDDNVFKKSPDERLNEVLSTYSTALTSAPYGWKALVYPSGFPTLPFSFYFKFDTANRVRMYSDWDTSTLTNARESSYRLKALQQPCLLFDTYSYIHILCDPDASVNGGYYGSGLLSDFEFILDGMSSNGDTIKLTGRQHASKAVLVKATSKEAQDYYDRKRNWDFNYSSRFLTYFKKLHTGKGDYDIYINHSFKRVRIVNANVKFSAGFYLTPTGVAFDKPFTDAGETIYGFDDVIWSENNQLMSLKVNGRAATINSDKKPYIVDSTAGSRWYNTALNAATYFIAPNGIHVDGQDDYYNLASVPGFTYLFYYPNFGQSGYDFNGLMEKSYYGPAYKAKFSTAGITTFTYGGTFYTIPDYSTTAISNIVTKFTESAGYYFVQTSDNNTYDMVNVKDARSWISWQLY